METLIVWAFDPGVTWGAVSVEIGTKGSVDRVSAEREFGVIGVWEERILGPTGLLLLLDRMWCAGGWRMPDVVVYEGFRLRPSDRDRNGGYGTADGMSPVLGIGWLQMALTAGAVGGPLGVVGSVGEPFVGEWVEQWPIQKGSVKNDILRKLGLWLVGSAGHAHDAGRHAVICLRKKNLL